ncbi:SigmaW regulon antibacterial [Rubripirellula obstinata]|uniref:SigmaW regulon antibacterial n=1 Tax=Rubripirellula obstinata TaxID=406547 RepID=A0A5B1CH34_9BACT|nr:SigmaW regulon antibacterial [Rubripirellula obstinata]
MQVTLGLAVLALLVVLFQTVLLTKWGSCWGQAYMCGADVSMTSLVVMTLLKLDYRMIVTAKIMVRQAGLPIDRDRGISTARLQAHALAGGERGISVGFRRGRLLNYCRIGVVTHPEGSRINQGKLSLIDPRS